MARIPFDIKYRPQIESGEYKVELRDGRSVKIIYWEAKGPAPIIGLFMTDDGSETTTEAHSNGRWSDDENYESDYDLFIITPEEEMTEFEKAVGLVFTDAQLIPRDKDGIANIHDINEFIKKKAAELLTLAKKELLKDDELGKKHLEGYIMGREETMREMNDFLKSHFNSEEAKAPNPPAINIPTWIPPCYNGGPCTNPQKDCINCPRANVVISPNTASGTSTLKAEG